MTEKNRFQITNNKEDQHKLQVVKLNPDIEMLESKRQMRKSQ